MNNKKSIIIAAAFIVIVIIAALITTNIDKEGSTKEDKKENKQTLHLITEDESDNTDSLNSEKVTDNDKDTESISETENEKETDTDITDDYVAYYFRNNNLLSQHYDKHGIDMGFSSKEEYEKAASDVVNNKNALHKIEEEDGDDVYYVEDTNEFVVVSTDGYIRTYFNPDAGIDYFNRQ